MDKCRSRLHPQLPERRKLTITHHFYALVDLLSKALELFFDGPSEKLDDFRLKSDYWL